MYIADFAALSGGRSFTEWLHDISNIKGPIAFVSENELNQLPGALQKSDWLAGQAARVEEEARSYLGIPIELSDLVNGHGHQFFCTDGTLLMPMEGDVGGKCPRCGKEYIAEQHQHGAAYLRQFEYIRRAMTLSTAYCLTGNLDFALETMRVLTLFADLHRRHGQLVRQTLDEAWRVSVLAYAYSLVAGAPCFSQEQRRQVEVDLFEAAARRAWLGYDLLGNWGACHDLVLGVVGLVLRDERFLRIALDGFMRRAHAYFRADGLGVEGSIGTYHNMTVHNMVSFAEAFFPAGINLYEAKFQRSGRERILEKLLDAQLHLAYPDARIPALHDGWYNGNSLICPDLYEMAFRRYGKPEYRQVADAFYTNTKVLGETPGAPLKRSQLSVWVGNPLMLPSYPVVWDYYVRSLYPSMDEWIEPQRLFPPRDFWTAYSKDGVLEKSGTEPSGIPKLTLESTHFPDAGYVVMRSTTDDLYVLCDYGSHGGGHGHPDKLNIVIYAHGRAIAPDYGTSAYGLPVAAQWYRRTLSHNTIMVDGTDQAASQGELYGLDLGGAYQNAHVAANHVYPGVCLERRLVMTNGLVLLFDTAQSHEPHTYDWLMHARGELLVPNNLIAIEHEPMMEYNFLRDPRWYSVTEQSGLFCWQGADGVGLDLRWVASAPVKLLVASGPGAPVEQYDPMISLRTNAQNVTYAAVLAPRVGGRRIADFTVDELDCEGSWKYRVTLTDGQVIEGTVS